MKKLLFSLIALVCSMSMNAQVTGNEKATTGTATRTGDVSVKWIQLWENGPKFAEYNVGVNFDDYDYGHYYAWGGSQDRVDDHNTGSESLTGDNDTATKVWGSNWRMPTQAELQALIDNCDIEWTKDYKNLGKSGKIFTGKGDYASNSIFLPAAGQYYRTFYYVRTCGGYRSSTPSVNSGASYMFFNSTEQKLLGGPRDWGFTIRAVLADNATAIESVACKDTNIKQGGKKVVNGDKLIIIANDGKMYNSVGIEIKK